MPGQAAAVVRFIDRHGAVATTRTDLLSHAEAGARHLLSVGRAGVEILRLGADGTLTPYTCVHCGRPIAFIGSWVHQGDRRPGCAEGDGEASPVPPVEFPERATPQEVWRLVAGAVRDGERASLYTVLERVLRERYRALWTARDRLFAGENRKARAQFNTERWAAEQHMDVYLGRSGHCPPGAQRCHIGGPLFNAEELRALAAGAAEMPVDYLP